VSLEEVYRAADALLGEDLIDQCVLVYLAGTRGPVRTVRALAKLDIEATVEQVQSIIQWPSKTPESKAFWRAVDEGQTPEMAARYLGKQALKDAAKAYFGQRAMMAEANEDKRTRNSAQQYHLGAVGHSPSQKHELTGSDDLLRLAKEMFEKKPDAGGSES
jgi:hypothetical protein